MRTPLDALITEKSLNFVHGQGNPDLADLVLNGPGSESLPVKNVCAKVAPELADEIDGICGLLGISKRRFLEAAFIEAVRKAKTIMAAEGVMDALDAEPPLGHELAAVEE